MKTKNLKYNITISTAPAMPKLGKGTECVQLLLSQVSKDMHEPLVPMLFPILGAQVSEAKFQYPDLSWKELCGMMANLVADSGCNKGQLSNIVEAICHNFREHDEKELDKLVEWQRQMKTKSANKEKPARPDVSFFSTLRCHQRRLHPECHGMREVGRENAIPQSARGGDGGPDVWRT